MPGIAEIVQRVPYSRVREIAEMAFKMDGVLKLYFGESTEPTPAFIKQAAVKALDDGFTFYTANAGLFSLRQAIADHYLRIHQVALDPAREIVVTASGVQALNTTVRCVLDPGDEVLVLSPSWPNAGTMAAMSDAKVIEVAQPLVGDHFEIDWDALEAAVTPRTKLLVYTSPSNPTGWVATDEDQNRLLEFIRRHDLWLLADEVYDRLWFQGPLGEAAPSILKKATRDDAVMVVQSFSKAYCMTGWRLGYAIARADAAKKLGQLNEYTVSNAAGFTQKACETALAQGEPFVHEFLAKLRANRDFCVDAMRSMPRLTVPRPDGAFYLFPRVEGLEDSFEFCKRLLEEKRVGIAPGMAFGKGGEGSLRVCYASDRSVLEPAMERLSDFLGAY